jgi:hypothetical protein
LQQQGGVREEKETISTQFAPQPPSALCSCPWTRCAEWRDVEEPLSLQKLSSPSGCLKPQFISSFDADFQCSFEQNMLEPQISALLINFLMYLKKIYLYKL